MLRDFDTADRWMDQALQLCDDRPWPWVERATILQMQDRYAQALESAEQALRLHPFYRPAVQSAAQLLQLLNRDREALELLQDASQQLESGDIVAQLAALQSELEMYPEARESWQRADSLLVLKDKPYRSFIAARRSDAAYHCGDEAECLHWAQEADAPFFKGIAEHLKSAPPGAKRVRLPVGFVRQHHMTCAPATLSALSSFWQMPANHLDVAEKICYDGTPSHSQRRWAEQNGYLAREFKLTWDAAVTLIDRGVPFTLTTVEPGNAHLQAIVGYDARRGTLLIRDPTFRTSGEALAKELLARYASTGPRAMVLVPRAMSHLLEAVDLPEQVLYDRLYRLEISLQGNDRKTAATELECLQAAGPEHRLAVLGRQILANYDRNLLAILAATEAHLKQFPSDVNAQLAQLSLLTQLSRRPDRLQRLHDLCTAPQADPILWLHEVRETIEDGRQHAALRGRLRKIIRFRPQMAGSYHELARIEWARQRRDTAVELFRFAACLDDKDERHAHSFFVSMRHVGRAAEALQMLQGRFKRFGLQSSQPARTLCWALEELGQSHEALQVIDKALTWRPEDGQFLLYAADFIARRGDTEKAMNLLQRAESCSSRNAWRLQTAALATYRGDTEAACRQYQAIVAEDPLAVDAQRTYTRLLADIYGLTKALEHLRAVVKQFPYHYLFNQLLVEWLREFDPPAVIDALGPMLDSFASDAWTRRELAIAYTRCLNGAAALREAEAAKDLEPSSSWSWSTLGYVHAQSGRIQEAREALRQSITLSVDNESAIAQLLDLSSTAAERLETIVFVYEELCKQVTLGEGLLAWREKAAGILDGITLLHVLLEALQARPDLWQTWSALVQQLTVLSHFERASEVGAAASSRFPLVPKLWLDLADVCRRRFDTKGERDALEQALRINPRWGAAVHQSLKQHAASDLVTAREVRLACLRCDRDAAQRLLVELCASSSGNQDSIRMASDAFAKAFGMRAATAVLHEWFRRADANPEVVPLLIEAYTKRGAFWKCRRTLKYVTNTTEAWRRGAITYLKAISSKKKRHSVWSFVKRNWKALRMETWTWGYVAEALSQMKLRPQVLKWCSDWRERQGLTPRMLFFAAINARYRFRIEQAQEMHRCALALPPDGWEHLHRLTMLVDDFAARGLPSGACETFAQINPELLGDFYRDLWALAKTWIEIMSPPKLATQRYSAAATQLDRALGKQLRGFRRFGPFKRWRHQLLARLAASRGRPLLTAWHDFRATTARWI